MSLAIFYLSILPEKLYLFDGCNTVEPHFSCADLGTDQPKITLMLQQSHRRLTCTLKKAQNKTLLCMQIVDSIVARSVSCQFTYQRIICFNSTLQLTLSKGAGVIYNIIYYSLYLGNCFVSSPAPLFQPLVEYGH